VANREAGGGDVINKLSIERATHSHDRPYIPASSLKGALRTALLDGLNAGRRPLSAEKGRGPNSWDSTKLETRLLEGDYATSPLRLLKPADLMPVGEPAREVLYALSRYKDLKRDKHGNERQPRGLLTRKECIAPGQYRAFQGDLVLQHLGGHDTPGSPRPATCARPTCMASPATATATTCRACTTSSPPSTAATSSTPPGRPPSKACSPANSRPSRRGPRSAVRLGRYGGAESKTLSGDGVAQIKIMQAKGMPPLYESRSRTVWLAAGHADRAHAALPFGWALVEIDPAAELPALRAWCDAQAARRPDMAARQARHAEARAVALAQQAARQAEREAAAAAEQQRLADEAERANRLARLSEALQEVESFADACRQREAQLRGGKDKPNTAHHARASQLATRAQAWAADEKAAAAAAIQHWIPLIVAIDPKELRKKLKLAALEPGA
jgi:CRISPR-associated protein Csm5